MNAEDKYKLELKVRRDLAILAGERAVDYGCGVDEALRGIVEEACEDISREIAGYGFSVAADFMAERLDDLD